MLISDYKPIFMSSITSYIVIVKLVTLYVNSFTTLNLSTLNNNFLGDQKVIYKLRKHKVHALSVSDNLELRQLSF